MIRLVVCLLFGGLAMPGHALERVAADRFTPDVQYNVGSEMQLSDVQALLAASLGRLQADMDARQTCAANMAVWDGDVCRAVPVAVMPAAGN